MSVLDKDNGCYCGLFRRLHACGNHRGRGLDTPGVDGEVKVLVLQAALRRLLFALNFHVWRCSLQLLSASRLPFVHGTWESWSVRKTEILSSCRRWSVRRSTTVSVTCGVTSECHRVISASRQVCPRPRTTANVCAVKRSFVTDLYLLIGIVYLQWSSAQLLTCLDILSPAPSPLPAGLVALVIISCAWNCNTCSSVT